MAAKIRVKKISAGWYVFFGDKPYLRFRTWNEAIRAAVREAYAS